MTNHPNRRRPWVEIKSGNIRLRDDGRVEHWDGGICCWRFGWGPYAQWASLGDDERTLNEWRARCK